MPTALQNGSPIQHLADWLAFKNSEPSTASKIQYHLCGRVALLGISLVSLAEAAGRAVLGSIAFLGFVMTLGLWREAKNFSIDQMEKGSQSKSIAFKCLRGVISPKEWVHRPARAYPVEPEGPLTPEMRSWRVRQGAGLIVGKLQGQFERAQQQAAQEPNKEFRYLPAPENFGGEAHTEKVAGYEVGVCHFIGRRPTMEDEHLATSFDLHVGGKVYPVQLFGIFDGHGGHEASLYVRENLKRELHETLNEFCLNGLTEEAIWNGLKITFVRLNEGFKDGPSGSTATVAMILDGKLWTANVGDARTILDNGIQLSEDAKPADPYYQKGIENRGGQVFFNRINWRLAVARAIGDRDVEGVSARPKITVYPLAKIPKGSHLILACDGIYDVSSTRQVAAAVRAHNKLTAEELAKNMVHSASEALSKDNLSVLVVKF